MSTPDKRLKFFNWLTAKRIVIDDIEKMEETIKEYQEYLRQKEFDERLKQREEQYKKDIKEHSEPPKPDDWWEEQMEEEDPPGEDEGDLNVPWYDKDGFHER